MKNEITNLSSPQNNFIKQGSFQLFVDHHDVADNFGSVVFSTDEVHKIGILDIRLNNCDRNGENILVQKIPKLKKDMHINSKYNFSIHMIPIDHGLTLPDCFDTCSYEVVWTDYPQSKIPFSQFELDFIRNIDPIADIQKITRCLKIRDICLRNFRITNILLKKCAEAGLTLFDISQIMYKDDPEEKTKIQKLVDKTEEFHDLVIPHIQTQGSLQQFLKSQKSQKQKPTLDAPSLNSIIEEHSTQKDEDEEYKEQDPFFSEQQNVPTFQNIQTRQRAYSGGSQDLFSPQFNKDISKQKVLSENKNEVRKKLFQQTDMIINTANDNNSTEDTENCDELIKKLKSPLLIEDSFVGVRLARTLSLPDLRSKSQIIHQQDEDLVNPLNENSLKPIKLLKITSLKSEALQNNKKYDPFDEVFFYYFGCFLDQLISVIQNDKKKQQGNRPRFYSQNLQI